MSKNVAEYNIDNDYIVLADSNLDLPFYPFSRCAFLKDKQLLVTGGLNDEVPKRQTFSSRVVRLREVPINFLESNYDAQVVQPMRVKRGCHAIAHVEGRVYVFGGQNHVDKLLKKCERYSLADDTWENIAQMHLKRKNCSACALTQHKIYVFGGTEH